MRSLYILVLLLFIGCDIFKTRDPETPSLASSDFKPPVTPDIVMENFRTAIKESNVENYIRCFVDSSISPHSFQFTPSINFQSVIQNWTLDDERRYFLNLGKPQYTVPSLTLTNLKQENVTPASTEYTMDYFLFYPHQKSSIAKQVNGYMRLYIAIDNRQQWSIYRWDDFKSTSDSTWSYLKYYLY